MGKTLVLLVALVGFGSSALATEIVSSKVRLPPGRGRIGHAKLVIRDASRQELFDLVHSEYLKKVTVRPSYLTHGDTVVKLNGWTTNVAEKVAAIQDYLRAQRKPE